LKIFLITEEEIVSEIRQAEEKKKPTQSDQILADIYCVLDSHKKVLESQSKTLKDICSKIIGLGSDEASS